MKKMPMELNSDWSHDPISHTYEKESLFWVGWVSRLANMSFKILPFFFCFCNFLRSVLFSYKPNHMLFLSFASCVLLKASHVLCIWYMYCHVRNHNNLITKFHRWVRLFDQDGVSNSLNPSSWDSSHKYKTSYDGLRKRLTKTIDMVGGFGQKYWPT